MAAKSDDRPNTIPWPPIIYAAALAVTFLLQCLIPIRPIAHPPASNLIGWPMFVWGILIAVVALMGFRAAGTSIDPTAPAKHLATAGIYAWSRNPMYLGALIAFAGLGTAIGATWLLILLPVTAVALRKLAIEREEAYLTRRFGDAYRAYLARVRRWL
jgi:protein-S-isoprenylcysteine O-methyltransferase Ste14